MLKRSIEIYRAAEKTILLGCWIFCLLFLAAISNISVSFLYQITAVCRQLILNKDKTMTWRNTEDEAIWRMGNIKPAWVLPDTRALLGLFFSKPNSEGSAKIYMLLLAFWTQLNPRDSAITWHKAVHTSFLCSIQCVWRFSQWGYFRRVFFEWGFLDVADGHVSKPSLWWPRNDWCHFSMPSSHWISESLSFTKEETSNPVRV